MTAVISGIYGAYYEVLLPQLHDRVLAKPAGKLRLAQKQQELKYNELPTRHLLSIGDKVNICKTKHEFRIEELLPRKNRFARSSHVKTQVLGANLNGVLIFASVVAPSLNIPFVERSLCEAMLENIPAAIIINKQDLLENNAERKSEHELCEKWSAIYKKLNIPVFYESFLHGISMDLQNYFSSKKTGTYLFVGQSGTGKSTFLNRFLGKNYQQVSEVAAKTGKGRHTTVNPVLIPVASDLFFIDCPGVREFGLYHHKLTSIRLAYPEFAQEKCKFADCLHLQEPGCAVKDNPQFRDRYYSYLNILSDFNEAYKPRRGDYRL